MTAEIPDIDGDDRPDTEWYSVEELSYGITTASGATLVLDDDLAGGGPRRGWTARLGSGVVVTVLDDGRTASLHALVDCAFVTTRGVDGEPYRFDLGNLRDEGTGVGCEPGEYGLMLVGFQALSVGDDAYSVTSTTVLVSADGTLAEDVGTGTLTESSPSDSPTVREAMSSSCGGIPVVTEATG